MELVLCDHELPCILKTGLKKGPGFGKSFYLCKSHGQDADCGVCFTANVPVEQCPEHGKPVSIRKWRTNSAKVYKYRCAANTRRGFCGNMEGAKENIAPAPVDSDPVDSKCSKTAPDGSPYSNTGPDGSPCSNTAPDGSPCSNTAPDGSPCSNTAPDGSPCSNTAPDDSPCSNTAPDDSPCSNTAPDGSPCSNTAPDDSPCSNTAPDDSPCSNTAPDGSPCSNTAPDDSPYSNTAANSSPCSNTAANDSPYSNTAANDSPCSNAVPDNSPCSTPASAQLGSPSGGPASPQVSDITDTPSSSVQEEPSKNHSPAPTSPHEKHYVATPPDSASLDLSDATSDSSQAGVPDAMSDSSQAGVQDAMSDSSQAGVQDAMSDSSQAGVQDAMSDSSQAGVQDAMSDSSQAGGPDGMSDSSQAGVPDGTSDSSQAGVQDAVLLSLDEDPLSGADTGTGAPTPGDKASADDCVIILDSESLTKQSYRKVEVIVSSDEEEEEEPETAERMQHKEPQVEQQPRPKDDQLAGGTEQRVLQPLHRDEPSLAAAACGEDEPDYTTVQPAQEKVEPVFKVAHQYRTLLKQLEQTESMIRTMSAKLPDGGAQLRAQREAILRRIAELKRPVPTLTGALPGGSQPASYHSKGKLTYQAKMLTVGAVEHLHSSLANCPTEQTLADTPHEMRIVLMEHQRRGLAWALWREAQTPSGGIVADDMGLGKTLMMLALVLHTRWGRHSSALQEWLATPPPTEGLMKTAGTLVICPASVMHQWKAEIESKLRPGALSVCVYHGSGRARSTMDLATYDVVITTYQTMGAEGALVVDEDVAGTEPPSKCVKKKRTAASNILFNMHWRRLILDEAHVIKNPKSGVSQGATKLKSDHRWAVTGTPIQNKLKDFYSLIRFIRLAPFDDFSVWRDTVERKGTVGMQRLNTMVSSLVLRRTKDEVGSEVLKLTKRQVVTHTITLNPEEERVYQVLFREARKVMYAWLKEQGENPHGRGPSPLKDQAAGSQPGATASQGSPPPPHIDGLVMKILAPYISNSAKGKCVLGLLLRLRQCCCHLKLLTSALKQGEADQDDLDLQLAMGTLAIADHSSGAYNPSAALPPEFEVEVMSTKICAVVEHLKEIAATSDVPPQKSLVISQWTSMLDIMQHHLNQAGISHCRIDGSVAPMQRQNLMSQFNAPNKYPTVMLLSLQAGGVGLNLTGANHVFLLDLHWNPALEVQAADRCHRVGQTRDVFVHKFVCSGTVEERILTLQQRKLETARNVLEGASQKARARGNKLSLHDLKHLFEIA